MVGSKHTAEGTHLINYRRCNMTKRIYRGIEIGTKSKRKKLGTKSKTDQPKRVYRGVAA